MTTASSPGDLPARSTPAARRPAIAALARWISIIGHPFTFVLVLVLASSWSRADGAAAAAAAALRHGAIVLGIVVLPLGLFFWWRRASGRWSTVDASAPRERPALYVAALGLLIPLAIYGLLVKEAGLMLRGTAAVAVLLAVAAAANRWIKLSLHTAFAVFVGVVLAGLVPLLGLGVLLFAPLLAWSRLVMQRHARAEVVGGAALGAAVGVLTLGL